MLGEFSHYLVVDLQNSAQKLIQSTNQRLSLIALDGIDSVASNNRKHPAKTLLSAITYNKRLDQLLYILMGDVCILPKDKKKPLSGDGFDWVSETGRYYMRGYIFKSSGKGRPSIIGRQQTLQKMKNEMQNSENSLLMGTKTVEKHVISQASTSQI